MLGFLVISCRKNFQVMSNKFTKIICLTLVLFIVFTASSCKKNNVKKIEVNNSFALSLLQDEVSVGELLERMDSTSVEWVRVLPDNTVCAIFYDTIRDIVSGAKLLDGVEDIQIQNSCDVDVPAVEIPAEVEQIWSYDPSYIFEYQIQVDVDTMFAVNFAVEQFELNSLVMESGNMAFHVNAAPEQSFPVQVQSAVMQTSEILYYSGAEYEVSLTNPGDVNQDLAGMVIEPENGMIVFSGTLNVSANIDKAAYDAMGGQIGGKVHIDVEGALANLLIYSIDGIMSEITQPYADTVDVKFGIKGLNGDLNLYRPNLSLSYVNTFGIGANAGIDSIGLFVDDEFSANYTSLLKEGFDVDLNANVAAFEPMTESVSSHVVDYINMNERYDGMMLNGNINIGGAYVENLKRDSHIDLAAEAVVPLQFKIDELKYTDTIKFHIDGGNVQKFLDGMEFKFRIYNGLPLEVTMQTYVLREDEVIDSLLMPGSNVVRPSYDGQYEFCEIITSIDGDERIGKILSADHLLLNISISTENNVVSIKADNSMRLEIGLKTKTNGIDINDVL